MTMKMVLAKLNWTSALEGGRSKGSPPNGTTYAPTAKFQERPNDFWSIMFTVLVVYPDGSSFVKMRFLSPNAPQELLHRNSLFRIFEGPFQVAIGEIESDVDLGEPIGF